MIIRDLMLLLIVSIEALCLFWGLATLGLSGLHFVLSLAWLLFEVGSEPDPLVPANQLVELAFLYGTPFVFIGVALEFFRRKLMRRGHLAE